MSSAPLASRAFAATDDMAAAIRAGDRAQLARAITLVESRREDHRSRARELLASLLPHTGGAHRIGITGVPGVGKSTFLEALGVWLTGRDHKVAVLAVDPSSRRTGGSILGDKTRMGQLAADRNAFIRPSPSAGTLGGVARATRETILLCEAAGYDVVFVETVGVGQSETMVAEMVDLFMVLMLPGAGDELQGIKKGILELAEILVVNKADGDRLPLARAAARDLSAALRILQPTDDVWTAKVLTASALTREGLEDVWTAVGDHRDRLSAAGRLQSRRAEQQVGWMWAQLEDRLLQLLSNTPAVAARLQELEAAVRAGTVAPSSAADEVLGLFRASGSEQPDAR